MSAYISDTTLKICQSSIQHALKLDTQFRYPENTALRKALDEIESGLTGTPKEPERCDHSGVELDAANQEPLAYFPELQKANLEYRNVPGSYSRLDYLEEKIRILKEGRQTPFRNALNSYYGLQTFIKEI